MFVRPGEPHPRARRPRRTRANYPNPAYWAQVDAELDAYAARVARSPLAVAARKPR